MGYPTLQDREAMDLAEDLHSALKLARVDPNSVQVQGDLACISVKSLLELAHKASLAHTYVERETAPIDRGDKVSKTNASSVNKLHQTVKNLDKSNVASLLDHLVKSASNLDADSSITARQAVEGIEAVLLACEAGITKDAEVMDRVAAVAGFLDDRGEVDAADLLDKICLAYRFGDGFPKDISREEKRKGLYDADAHNDETRWNQTKKEVADNRKINHHPGMRDTAKTLSTRYSPELPGIPVIFVAPGVAQDVVTKKLYDYNTGFTLDDGTKYPASGVENQTPAWSQYSSTPRMFDSRIELSKRRQY